MEVAHRVGDQISFLKRWHTLTEIGTKIAISDHYAKSMAKILEIRGGMAQTPDLADFGGHDTSHVLSGIGRKALAAGVIRRLKV